MNSTAQQHLSRVQTVRGLMGKGWSLQFPAPDMTHAEFFSFCQELTDLQIERSKEGEVKLRSPVGGGGSNRNFTITSQFGTWVWKDGTGVGFDSSGGFNLPNGATRSPDLAWVLKERLADLAPRQKEEFLPLCPDFAVELRSKSDSLTEQMEKMDEYIENGARLGWLIDPKTRRVHVYRPDRAPQILEDPPSVSGDPLLPGFVLDLTQIFNPQF